MGSVLLALWLGVAASAGPARDVAQATDQARDETLFVFRSGFWVNLHHFLYVLGRARIGSPDSRRAAVVKAPADVAGPARRPEKGRVDWGEGGPFYVGGVAAEDAGVCAERVRTAAKHRRAPEDPHAAG